MMAHFNVAPYTPATCDPAPPHSVSGTASYVSLLLLAAMPTIMARRSLLSLTRDNQNSGWCGADEKGAPAGTSPALPRNRQASPSFTR